jgi:hypothetical protein
MVVKPLTTVVSTVKGKDVLIVSVVVKMIIVRDIDISVLVVETCKPC